MSCEKLVLRKFSATRCCTSNDVFIKFSFFIHILFSFSQNSINIMVIGTDAVKGEH